MTKSFQGIPQELRYEQWSKTFNQVVGQRLGDKVPLDDALADAKKVADAAHGPFNLIDRGIDA